MSNVPTRTFEGLGRLSAKDRLVSAGAGFIMAAVMLVLPGLGAHFLFPHTVEKPVVREKTIIVEKKIFPELPAPPSPAQIERRAIQRAMEIFKDKSLGELKIIGDEASTVRYKRAAIASKNGFTDLKHGEDYKILAYVNDEGIGYGIVDVGDGKLCSLEWYPGALKEAPARNPVTFRVIQGVKIGYANP